LKKLILVIALVSHYNLGKNNYLIKLTQNVHIVLAFCHIFSDSLSTFLQNLSPFSSTRISALCVIMEPKYTYMTFDFLHFLTESRDAEGFPNHHRAPPLPEFDSNLEQRVSEKLDNFQRQTPLVTLIPVDTFLRKDLTTFPNRDSSPVDISER
jgi:hypothetical protein